MFPLKHQYVQTCSLKEKNWMLLLILLSILLLCIVVWIQWFNVWIHLMCEYSGLWSSCITKRKRKYIVDVICWAYTWYPHKCITVNHPMQHMQSLHCSMQELQELLYTRHVTCMCSTIYYIVSQLHNNSPKFT